MTSKIPCKYSKAVIIKLVNKLYEYEYEKCNTSNREYKPFCFTIFLKENFSKTTLKILFNYYASCNCCTTHSNFKPQNLNTTGFNPNPSCSKGKLKSQTETKPCSCPCRSNSRFLWSAYNYEY